MTKKEYILKVLDAVKNARPMAPWLRILVDNNALNDQLMDSLIALFREAANKTLDQKSKAVLVKTVDILEDVKHKEEIDHENDLADLAELESMFKDV